MATGNDNKTASGGVQQELMRHVTAMAEIGLAAHKKGKVDSS